MGSRRASRTGLEGSDTTPGETLRGFPPDPLPKDRPRIAINGFGRIGRLVARRVLATNAADLVAVNDLATPEMLAHLFEHDSLHGRWPAPVDAEGDEIVTDGARFRVLAERDPAKLPWRQLGIDYVVESTGRFRRREELQKHLDAGARRVILTAPGKGMDVTLVRGVNMHAYDPAKHRFVSISSCTTYCVTPVLKVLNESFGLEQAVMTTVHAYTNDQRLLDGPHDDPRRARAAAMSIIPTSTGAAEAVAQVMPEIEGKVEGIAVRVPVANVSLADINARLARPVTREELEQAFLGAASGPLRGVLAVEREPLVSVDFNDHPASSIVDLPGLMVIDGSMVKVLAWYDNEYGYSNRVAEVLQDLWAVEPERRERMAVER